MPKSSMDLLVPGGYVYSRIVHGYCTSIFMFFTFAIRSRSMILEELVRFALAIIGVNVVACRFVGDALYL